MREIVVKIFRSITLQYLQNTCIFESTDNVCSTAVEVALLPYTMPSRQYFFSKSLHLSTCPKNPKCLIPYRVIPGLVWCCCLVMSASLQLLFDEHECVCSYGYVLNYFQTVRVKLLHKLFK